MLKRIQRLRSLLGAFPNGDDGDGDGAPTNGGGAPPATPADAMDSAPQGACAPPAPASAPVPASATAPTPTVPTVKECPACGTELEPDWQDGAWVAGCLGCGRCWRWDGDAWQTMHAPDHAFEPDESAGDGSDGDGSDWDGGISSALSLEGDNLATNELDGAPAEFPIPHQGRLFDEIENRELPHVLSRFWRVMATGVSDGAPPAEDEDGCGKDGGIFAWKDGGGADAKESAPPADASAPAMDRTLAEGERAPQGESAPQDAPAPLANRFTERAPDGTITLRYERKGKPATEIVRPAELDAWEPIENIPAATLPSELPPLPPALVLDIECTGLNAEQDRVLAVGLLFSDGKRPVREIVALDDERKMLIAFHIIHTFLRDYPNALVVGYNVREFDIPFLCQRARALGIESQNPFEIESDGERVLYVGCYDVDGRRHAIVDVMELVKRWDAIHHTLPSLSLKDAAAVILRKDGERPIIPPTEMEVYFRERRAEFDAYLRCDLIETLELWRELFPPYHALAHILRLSPQVVCERGTGWLWNYILCSNYPNEPAADERGDYAGSAVVYRRGLWRDCFKIDIASLYPTIMLAYRIHSRKDRDGVALSYLRTLTEKRLEMKRRAKEGDKSAAILSDAFKILINSLYGFYASPYEFNDYDAAARVTEIGRKVFATMLTAIEDAGGIVVEGDTDGVIVSAPDPILTAIRNALPAPF